MFVLLNGFINANNETLGDNLGVNYKLIKNEELKRALQEMNYTNFFNRLNFLFKVVDNLDKFSKEFAENCVKEIEELMSLPINKEVAENDNKESE